MPAIGPALQPCAGPETLGYNFVLKLNPTGSALTYLSFEDSSVNRVTLAVAPDGSLHEAAGTVRRIVNLDTPGATYFSRQCILNAASLKSHTQSGISAGEILALKGTGLGPAAAGSLTISNGLAAATLEQTQVLFDG